MFWTIIVFALGWGVGRNWDQVKAMATNKLQASKNADGGVTRLNDD